MVPLYGLAGYRLGSFKVLGPSRLLAFCQTFEMPCRFARAPSDATFWPLLLKFDLISEQL